jgi:hypothetical protein
VTTASSVNTTSASAAAFTGRGSLPTPRSCSLVAASWELPD